MPIRSTARLAAFAIFASAFLAACSDTQQASLPPETVTPAMCKSSRPPAEPDCTVPVILYGAPPEERELCIAEMKDYMESIGQWRDCHLDLLQKDTSLSDHDRKDKIDGTNFYADYDLKNAQANTACLKQGANCLPM
jgi:hypothetical protein